MIVTLPEKAIETLRSALKGNPSAPQNIRIHFAGIGWGGPSFGIALDEQKDSDVSVVVEELNFIMDKEEHEKFGDIEIRDTGYGFKIIPSKLEDEGGCGSCGGGCQ